MDNLNLFDKIANGSNKSGGTDTNGIQEDLYENLSESSTTTIAGAQPVGRVGERSWTFLDEKRLIAQFEKALQLTRMRSVQYSRRKMQIEANAWRTLVRQFNAHAIQPKNKNALEEKWKKLKAEFKEQYDVFHAAGKNGVMSVTGFSSGSQTTTLNESTQEPKNEPSNEETTSKEEPNNIPLEEIQTFMEDIFDSTGRSETPQYDDMDSNDDQGMPHSLNRSWIEHKDDEFMDRIEYMNYKNMQQRERHFSVFRKQGEALLKSVDLAGREAAIATTNIKEITRCMQNSNARLDSLFDIIKRRFEPSDNKNE
ncbi:hypothetical protein F4703DRAFT_1944382 [Phycomyces blakesleeanus]